ncbi:alginate lyase family protein [Nakamurella sp. GG22]
MSKASWYVGRLRSMSLAEVGWRTGRLARGRLAEGPLIRDSHVLGPETNWPAEFDRFRRAADRPVVLARDRARAIAAAEPALTKDMIAAARKAAELRVAYFGYPEVEIPRPTDWNYDPVSHVRWPDLPARQIDHRTAAGDVKWIWELNRLQHLPLLTQAWLITGEKAFSEAACEQLDSWLAQNPPGNGIAWRGAFEAGIRAISVSLAVQGLRDSDALTLELYREVVCMLAETCRRCWAERSLYSSANNHLVGELAGLATVAILFPELAGARRWERRAVSALVTQADRQILPDGAGAEQAVGYQVFAAELMLVVAHLLWLRDGLAPVALTNAVDRSAGYLSAVIGERDPAPRYGDDDEGFALRLGPEPVRTVREHLAIVGAASGNAAFSARGTNSLTARWLTRPRAVIGSVPPDDLYARDGGLVVLRAGTRRVTMDVGPLGYLSTAAHGHADALAVTLSSDGVEFVGDPGSGSYYGDPERRRVHRGTRVHATVTVDGTDQSVIGGPFLWTRHARVQVRAVDLGAGIVDAEHDGYGRLDPPVRHRRWLIAPPEQATVLVVDLLTGAGEHDATVSWPLAPKLRPSQSARGFRVEQTNGPGLQVCYAATVETRGSQVRGEKDSLLGWWSERLERPVPASLLGVHGSGPLPLVFATLLRPDGDGEPVEDLRVGMSRDWIEVRWFTGRTVYAVGIDPGGDAAVTSSIGDW